MSNGNPTPNLPKPPTAARFNCQKCGKEMMTRIAPPRIMNAPDVTVIVFPHERMDCCPYCGTYYAFVVGYINEQLQLGCAWQPVETEKSAITPGTENNLRIALTDAEITSKLKQ